MVAFPNVLSSKHTKLVGNPIREDILSIEAPKQRYSRRGGLNILVVGGSLGASIFNEVLPKVFAEVLADKPDHIASITHQVGQGDIDLVEKVYKSFGFCLNEEQRTENQKIPKINIVNFIDNIAAVYSKTDLVICRSGASTVSEICAVGIAAIFVPYPHAVDDHQLYNAKPLVDANAAMLILQSELAGPKLADMIFSLERKDCQLMADHARKLAIRNSTTQIKDIITTFMPNCTMYRIGKINWRRTFG